MAGHSRWMRLAAAFTVFKEWRKNLKPALSLAALALLYFMLSGIDSTVVRAQLIPITAPKWAFSSGAIVGGNPADTNVAASSTHICITTRAGFKCFAKSGTPVSPGTADCDSLGRPVRPEAFAAGEQLAREFFSRSCRYVPPDTATGSTKDGRIVFGSTYQRFFMVFQNRISQNKPARLLIAVSKSEDPRDGWWTYIDEVGGNNNSEDYQFLGVNSSILVVSNKMKTMDANNAAIQLWTDHTIYGVAELAEGNTSYVKKIWPPYNVSKVCDGCAEQPPFSPYSPSSPPPEKNTSAPEFLAAACVHESATTDFFWVHRDDNSSATVFGRRDGKVKSLAVPLRSAFNPVDGKQMDNDVTDTTPAPAIVYTDGAGANYQNCVFRNNKLVAVANIGQKWSNNPAGNVVSNAVRLIRLDVSDFFATPGSVSVEIDRIFGKSSPGDPTDAIFDYGWPAVATNSVGDIVVGSVRSRQTMFPEQRASIWLHGESDMRPSVSIRTGLDMAGGKYHMAGAAADPATDAVYLAQEYPVSGNKRVWITKMLGKNQPDVIALSLTLPSTVVRGAVHAGSLTIMNQGDAAMPDFKVSVHLSTDDTITPFDLALDSFAIRGLEPGKTAVVPLSIPIPRASNAGPYYVGARLDIDDVAVEHSDKNNANPFLKSGRGNTFLNVQ